MDRGRQRAKMEDIYTSKMLPLLPPSSPLKEGGNYLPHDFSDFRISAVSGFRRKNSPPRLRGGVGEGRNMRKGI